MTVRSDFASTGPGVQTGSTNAPHPCLRISALAPVCARAFALAALSLGTLGACTRATAPAGIPIERPAPLPAAPVVDRPPMQWNVARPSTPATFELDTQAIVVARADTLSRTDTIRSHGELLAVPRGAALDVTVSSFGVTTGAQPGRSLAAPVRVLGRFQESGGIAFEGAATADCTSLAATAVEATRDLWVRLPQTVRPRDSWKDSVQVAVCREGIPLTLHITREFRVDSIRGPDSTALLSVTRRSAVLLSGRGRLRGDTVIVTGRGTGEAVLRWSAATGWLVDGRGTSTLQLEARTGERTQRVDQQVRFEARQRVPTPP